jgi:hypothetical protein
LRETYISISRARIRVIVALNAGAVVNATLQETQSAGLISQGTVE